jgi:hypothetical protein
MLRQTYIQKHHPNEASAQPRYLMHVELLTPANMVGQSSSNNRAGSRTDCCRASHETLIHGDLLQAHDIGDNPQCTLEQA